MLSTLILATKSLWGGQGKYSVHVTKAGREAGGGLCNKIKVKQDFLSIQWYVLYCVAFNLYDYIDGAGWTEPSINWLVDVLSE